MNLSKSHKIIEEAWNVFLLTGDPVQKDRLIEHYLYLVKIAMGRLIYTLPSYIDREDLEGYGVIGLLQALERFRPEAGVRFETYALSRIRGSAIDYLRSLDPLSRGQRKTFKEIMVVWQTLQRDFGRDPTLEEIADEMNMSMEEVSWVIEKHKSSVFFSLEQERKENGRSLGEEVIDQHPRCNPQEILENKELVEFLGRVVDELPEREKLCITLYYFEGLTLKEMGAVLEVGESRVSQILSRAIIKLRSRMDEWKGGKDEE